MQFNWKDKFKTILVHSTDSTLFQLIRYTFVGGLAFVVDFGLLYILTEYIHLHYLVSATVSFIAGLIVNYIISTSWVFNKKTIKNKRLEFFIFFLIGLAGLGFNNLFLWLFTDYFAIYYLISKILTTIIVYFWNFFARKYILFNKNGEDKE